jgi:hypothetical protein
MAAVIDPPETLDTRAAMPRMPASLRYQNAPRWKSIAR